MSARAPKPRYPQMVIYLVSAAVLAFLAGRGSASTPKPLFECDIAKGLAQCSSIPTLYGREALIDGKTFVINVCEYLPPPPADPTGMRPPGPERVSCALQSEGPDALMYLSFRPAPAAVKAGAP
jgi:hypothetical protein